MVTIKNVVLAGATGNLGPDVLNALLKSGKFNVTALKRKGSASTVSHSVKVVEVDYESVEDLTSALHGQDAVISTLNATATDSEIKLIDASLAAGVKRFIPADFGCDINEKTKKFPVFGNKVKVETYLEEKARTTPLTYTFIYTGPFLDWGITKGFIFDASQHKPTIYDSGDIRFSTTTLAAIGTSVAGVLAHYEETKNRGVHVYDAITTQNEILAIAKKLSPGKTWEPEHVSLKDKVTQADANIAKGVFDLPTLFTYIYLATFGEVYGAEFKKPENDLLGVKVLSKEEFEAVVERSLPKN